MAVPTKKELADVAIQLFGNIDQSDQFSINDLFYHCDNKYLVYLIYDLLDTIEKNNGRHVVDKQYVEQFVEEAKEVLSRVPKDLKPLWEVL